MRVFQKARTGGDRLDWDHKVNRGCFQAVTPQPRLPATGVFIIAIGGVMLQTLG